jgi:tryptophan synthase beta chain
MKHYYFQSRCTESWRGIFFVFNLLTIRTYKTMKTLKNQPDERGFFGEYGGQFVPEELKVALDEVAAAYEEAKKDKKFIDEYENLLKNYVGRPSPLYFAKNLSEKLGGAKIYLKREDLNHTGAHKINHCLGEALLAKRMGKKKLLAETGAGQHGVALATAAAITGLECEIHMGAIDVAKQHPNVIRMKLLGAKVVEVKSGGRCLKDAVDSAFGVYMKDYQNTFFAIGSVVGPHPYPMMVRDFQSVVGKETRAQIMEQEKRLPDYLIACVGGGSNAMGLFYEFLEDKKVGMIGVEPGGKSFKPGDHAATLTLGKPGTLHGMFTYLLQDKKGEPLLVHSIASGLDYPGVGPNHSHLKDSGRVEYVSINDKEALDAFQELSKVEGIIPALESSHAIAQAMKIAPKFKGKIMVVNLSGRGDKDVDYVAEKLGM